MKGIPLTIPELYWQLIGEKMADGFSMYRHIWEPLEPLSAGTYYVIDRLTGRNPVNYYIINIIIIAFQALFFHFLCTNNNLYSERSSFPALLYILFASLCFDFFTLPPVILGMTFMLPALYLILLQFRYKMSDEGMLYTGLMIGISAMFYLPYLLFVPFMIFAFALFSAGEFRKYILFILGVLIPISLVILYYFVIDGSAEFFNMLVFSYFRIPAQKYVEFKTVIFLAIIPAIAALMGVYAISGRTTYVNYQFNVFKLSTLWLLAGLITILFTLNFTPSQLFVFVPALAYISTHFFLLVRHRLTTEITFWLLFLSIPLILILQFNTARKDLKENTFAEYVVKPLDTPPVPLENKRILVLGEAPGAYLHSKLATPYLNWHLSIRHFRHLNNLKVLTEIHRNFENDLPEVIIDETRELKDKKTIESIFKAMPVLGRRYERIPHENAWILKGKE
jgi:hypothetical protein